MADIRLTERQSELVDAFIDCTEENACEWEHDVARAFTKRKLVGIEPLPASKLAQWVDLYTHDTGDGPERNTAITLIVKLLTQAMDATQRDAWIHAFDDFGQVTKRLRKRGVTIAPRHPEDSLGLSRGISW